MLWRCMLCLFVGLIFAQAQPTEAKYTTVGGACDLFSALREDASKCFFVEDGLNRVHVRIPTGLHILNVTQENALLLRGDFVIEGNGDESRVACTGGAWSTGGNKDCVLVLGNLTLRNLAIQAGPHRFDFLFRALKSLTSEPSGMAWMERVQALVQDFTPLEPRRGTLIFAEEDLTVSDSTFYQNKMGPRGDLLASGKKVSVWRSALVGNELDQGSLVSGQTSDIVFSTIWSNSGANLFVNATAEKSIVSENSMPITQGSFIYSNPLGQNLQQIALDGFVHFRPTLGLPGGNPLIDQLPCDDSSVSSRTDQLGFIRSQQTLTNGAPNPCDYGAVEARAPQSATWPEGWAGKMRGYSTDGYGNPIYNYPEVVTLTPPNLVELTHDPYLTDDGIISVQPVLAWRPLFRFAANGDLPRFSFGPSPSSPIQRHLNMNRPALFKGTQAYEIFVIARSGYKGIQFLTAGSHVWGYENFEIHLFPHFGARFIPTNGVYLDVGTQATGNPQEYTDGSWHVFHARWNTYTKEATFSVDGLLETYPAPVGPPTSDHSMLTLGVRGNATYPLHGDIGEVIVFPFELTAEDRDAVFAYLVGRW